MVLSLVARQIERTNSSTWNDAPKLSNIISGRNSRYYYEHLSRQTFNNIGYYGETKKAGTQDIWRTSLSTNFQQHRLLGKPKEQELKIYEEHLSRQTFNNIGYYGETKKNRDSRYMKNISLNKLLATMAFLIGKPKQELKICVDQLSTKIGIVGKPKQQELKMYENISLSTNSQQWNVHVKNVHVENIVAVLLFDVPLVVACFCLPIDKAGMAFIYKHTFQAGRSSSCSIVAICIASL